MLCRHFPEIAGTFGYDDLRPITEPIAKGDFHTLSAAWSVLALKSYAGLAKASGVRAGIAEVVGADAKTLDGVKALIEKLDAPVPSATPMPKAKR